jgi:TolB-like protein
MTTVRFLLAATAVAAVWSGTVFAADQPAARKAVVAFSGFTAEGGVGGEETAVSTVMQALLSQSAKLTLVDRQQMDAALKELQLAQQGVLVPERMRELGKIVGAQYFCSGHLSKAGEKVMATARVVDIESTVTKLVYTFLASKNAAEAAGKALAGQVEATVAQFEAERAQAAAAPATPTAKVIPEGWKRPTVMVIIPEMHVRQPQLIDPAAETELIKRLIQQNFKVIDSEYVALMQQDQAAAKRLFGSLNTATQFAKDKKADVLLYGQAVSEYGAGLGEFEGCRGRVELKAIDVRSDAILLADSAEGGATDLAEAIAGKKAIQQAANRLADTFLYGLAEKWNGRK